MLEHLINHIENNLSFLKESKLLIAISGGLDSVVLTHLCYNLELNISLAHCNFKLRGNESDADESFILDLAEKLDIEAFVESFNTEDYAKTNKLSIQMAARELRYNWFQELAEDLGFDYILTAHHADDNLETFLINLTRGSGLKGLSGIPVINRNIVRPLLSFSRVQLEDYAKANNLKWQEDSSNTTDNYLRNKLRHHIIPRLKEFTPALLSNFNQTISNLNDTADIVEESLNAVTKRAVADIDEHQIKFKVSELKKLNNPKAYIFELFKDYGFTEWDDVLNLLNAQSGKQVFSETHRLVKDRNHLILKAQCHSERSKTSLLVHKADKQIKTPIGILFFDEADAVVQASQNHIFVDEDKLRFPIQLRKWQHGDVFFPLGMTGKKKLSKYFKDEKLSIIDKEQIWLLLSEDKIVWVVGMRADERFKVSEKTANILKVKLK